jgi:ketosteroid isomerase-like protein
MIAALASASAQVPAQDTPANRAKLELTERDFQRATIQKGVEGWNAYFSDHGAQYQNNSKIVRGHGAIRALMGDFLADTTALLVWWPISSEVAAREDMAYTFGASGVVARDSTGRLAISGRGTYLTVWSREKNGWKAVADMGGNASPSALGRAGDPAASRAIAEIESTRNAAISSGSRATLERIYSFDFLAIQDRRVRDRGEFLRALLQPVPGVHYTVQEQQASVSGETGIVAGVLYADRDKVRVSASSFIHVYVRRNGKWQLVRGVSATLK